MTKTATWCATAVALTVFPAWAESRISLVNPGFEQEAEGWTNVVPEFARLTGEAAHTGEVGMRIEDKSDKAGSSVRSAPVAVEPGKSYAVRFWARALAHTGDDPWPYATDPALLEGAAWGTAYAGCSTSTRKALLAAAADDGPVWYGIGRADLYCRSYEGDLVDEIPAEHRDSFARGLEDAWVRDYAPRGIPLEGTRPTIRIY